MRGVMCSGPAERCPLEPLTRSHEEPAPQVGVARPGTPARRRALPRPADVLPSG